MNSIRRMTSMLRNEYHGEGLNLADFSHDPVEQFGRWMEDALSYEGQGAKRRTPGHG
jgi:pyridoxine/pyridoxamine 5'-phosphate oxidase